MPKAVKKKNLNKTLPRIPWGIKSGSIPTRGYKITLSVSKIDLLVEAAKTKANQVLGSPPTVSTRRVESTTSKATVSEEVPVLANLDLKRQPKLGLTKRSS